MMDAASRLLDRYPPSSFKAEAVRLLREADRGTDPQRPLRFIVYDVVYAFQRLESRRLGLRPDRHPTQYAKFRHDFIAALAMWVPGRDPFIDGMREALAKAAKHNDPELNALLQDLTDAEGRRNSLEQSRRASSPRKIKTIWTGHVAASLDLAGLLEGTFNDRLSECLLAIVDEVNEGGAQKYRIANRLRQLVTAEVREINPKYGRKRLEHNAARWLIFSNHTGALPLDEHDRRFWVVNHEGAPRDASYYIGLYALLRDPTFVASVAEFLRQRDISGFNPGQRPPMNEAKAALVEFSQSEDDAVCKALVSRWPVDLITRSELNLRLPFGSEVTKSPVRHSMDRSARRLPRPT